jgi:predicted RNA binding protein YcfA (HicA-like mRNA interferase family)
MKVREVIRRLNDAGWKQVRMRGSHRVFAHEERPGIVVVPGNLGKELATGTLNNI